MRKPLVVLPAPDSESVPALHLQALGYIPASQSDLQDMFCRWTAIFP